MASFQIPKNEKLSPAESDVEKRFAALVCENLEQLIAEYSKRFGRVIDVDRARELCPDYAASGHGQNEVVGSDVQSGKGFG